MNSVLKSWTFSNKGHLNGGPVSKLTCIKDLSQEHFNLEASGEKNKKVINTHTGLPGLSPMNCSMDFLLWVTLADK